MLFRSIEEVERKTLGSVLFPISVTILFISSKENANNLYYILPVLILSLSDPIASIIGIKYNKTSEIVFLKHKFNKTYIGSFAFFLSALVISIVVLSFYSFAITHIILISAIIAFVATIVELLSSKGFDNLTVPLFVLLILYLLV